MGKNLLDDWLFCLVLTTIFVGVLILDAMPS